MLTGSSSDAERETVVWPVNHQPEGQAERVAFSRAVGPPGQVSCSAGRPIGANCATDGLHGKERFGDSTACPGCGRYAPGKSLIDSLLQCACCTLRRGAVIASKEGSFEAVTPRPPVPGSPPRSVPPPIEVCSSANPTQSGQVAQPVDLARIASRELMQGSVAAGSKIVRSLPATASRC